MNYSIVSFDLCGTVADCRIYDDLWYRIIPELYSKRFGMNFEESVRMLREIYRSAGPSDINWYRPSYWVEKFSLDKAEYRKLVSGIKLSIDESIIRPLKKRYRIILATNVASEVLELTVNMKLFDDVYSCIDMKMTKKDERFWRRLISEEGVKPYMILHMGDDYVYDYLIPSLAGIRAQTTSFNKVSTDLQRELQIRPQSN